MTETTLILMALFCIVVTWWIWKASQWMGAVQEILKEICDVLIQMADREEQ